MWEAFRQVLSQGKDWGAGVLARTQLNKRLEPYGTMVRLQIDSTRKTVELELMLKGEVQPIILTVQEYAIEDDPEGLRIVIKRVSSSREWITVAAQNFVVGRKFAVPKEYAQMLRLVV